MTNTLINVDLSQAELRAMAVLSQDQWMINALQEGQGDYFDNHMMPIAFPKIVRDYSTVEEYKAAEPVLHKEDRTKCKAVVYGLAFGREARAIGDSLKMPTNEAQLIIDNYLDTAAQFAQWRVDVQEAAINPSKRDMLINPFGRRFQSEIVTTRNFRNVQREALSFLPQSTSSDICLSTAIRINEPVKASGFKIINMVHDAIMFEGPEDRAEVLAEYVMDQLLLTGRAVMGDSVPFLSDWSKGKSWSDLS